MTDIQCQAFIGPYLPSFLSRLLLLYSKHNNLTRSLFFDVMSFNLAEHWILHFTCLQIQLLSPEIIKLSNLPLVFSGKGRASWIITQQPFSLGKVRNPETLRSVLKPDKIVSPTNIRIIDFTLSSASLCKALPLLYL